MNPNHSNVRPIRADYWEPEPVPGPRHLKLSLPGALALFGGGWMAALAIACAVSGRPLLALASVVVAGLLLGIAALDAAAEPARGWYVRQRGSLFFRRNGGRSHG
ncbi:hypothetical protein KHC23_07645 [Ancylobacter dichloromethanicus]|uniref:Uncharacterized protein n=1 Tax=Ancylobacter dichloromethanicus TaxID=518825 RepID=A0A9W6J8Z7_9HYPH|nr:hypothetical protein [Ancylobacter dichloromethanicus]MBS7553519.1 hypothetical protein [Ancylobacter dichloromethanicus]GLK72577.1 hypothetical protein GCM10017643_26930 [Ancylobacter dichloromethanicus]